MKNNKHRRGIDPCITDGCKRVIWCRGLCRSHYNTFHKRIEDRKTTELELLEHGLILKSVSDKRDLSEFGVE